MTARERDADDRDALLRRLRATALVNAQLRAQLDAPGPASTAGARPAAGPGPAVRRQGAGEGWVDELVAADGVGGEAVLRTAPSGEVVLVEGSLRRPVRAGLLVAALEGVVGRVRPASADELSGTVEGPPVELLEAPTGPPFVVVAGRRHDVRGVPVPYPVSGEVVAGLDEGDELRVRAGGRSGTAKRPEAAGRAGATDARAVGGPRVVRRARRLVGRTRRAVQRRGVAGATRRALRRVGAGR
jgi:hypothetical protein